MGEKSHEVLETSFSVLRTMNVRRRQFFLKYSTIDPALTSVLFQPSYYRSAAAAPISSHDVGCDGESLTKH